MVPPSRRAICPVYLNNKGVTLLEAGRCEDAAICFKSASKLMMAVIANERARIKDIPGSISEPNEGATPSPHQDSMSITTPTSTDISHKRKGVPQPTSDSCDAHERKRRRRGTLTRTSPQPAHYLGRPLWIRAKHERTCALNSVSLSATLLYNLGLTFNLMAIRKSEGDAVPTFRKALQLYKMSSDIMLRGPVINSLDSPVFIVAIHNMSQVHAVLGEAALVSIYQNRVVNILRLMAAARGASNRQYEEFYIKLLSLPKAISLASAA